MRCPQCGHEVGQDEAFCGQCGAPITPAGQATEMVYTPPPARSGQLKLPPVPSAPLGHNNGKPAAPTPTVYNTNILPQQGPPNAPTPGAPLDPNAAAPRPGGQQPGEFYQDATEAISLHPSNQGLPPGYNPASFLPPPQQGPYATGGQYGPQMQPFQAGAFTQHSYPQAPQYPGGQSYAGYGVQPQFTPPPPRQKPRSGLLIASIVLAIVLISVIAFGAFYLARGHSSPQVAATPTHAPTAAPTAAPTLAPTPSPTATSIPSPTATPTPAADPNFSWCTTACTTRGFIVEYPNGWNQGLTSDQTGVTFLNPAQQDEYAAFKVPVTQAGTNANQLVVNDLQSGFANQPGYTPPASTAVTTIGGETWTYGVAYYQPDTQRERVEVFATVHLGKNYVIELQAADSVFDQVNNQYYSTMIGRYQFQQA